MSRCSKDIASALRSRDFRGCSCGCGGGGDLSVPLGGMASPSQDCPLGIPEDEDEEEDDDPPLSVDTPPGGLTSMLVD